MNQLPTSNHIVPSNNDRSAKGHTLSVFVNNKPGVLMRICQVFARRAYNIDSLVVSYENDNRQSRMTIDVIGDPEGLTQIINQINRLIDVIHCIEHTTDDAVIMELALIKILAPSESFVNISQIINHFEGKTIDMNEGTLIVMFQGSPKQIDWSLQLLSKYDIVEIVRTGKLAMARSNFVT